MTEEEYRAMQTARQNLTEQTLKVTSQSQPIPTQEELDLMRLGHMHVDEKAHPDSPEMPPLELQQAYLKRAVENPGSPELPPAPGVPGAPTVVDVPHVAGAGVVGEMLTSTMGNCTGEPTSYGYSWKRNATTDIGAGDSYVVTADDAGSSITCVVTATNATGATTAPPSNAITVAPAAARMAPRR